MELRQLYYALKVAEERNFSRAAEKLHIAQPSLSQQILKLEKELDVSLFDRTTNSVELTYAGERFTEAAGRILDLTEQLKNEMRDISDVKKGKLVIGSMPMTGAHLLPIILPAFQAKYPGIEIHLVEETSRHGEIIRKVPEKDLVVELKKEIDKLAEEHYKKQAAEAVNVQS